MLLEVIGATNVLTVNEDLGSGVASGQGPNSAEGDLVGAVNENLLVAEALGLQELLGADAVGAAGHGEDGDGGGGLGVGEQVVEHRVRVRDLEGVALLDGLDEHLLDDGVLDVSTVAPRALSKANSAEVAQHSHAVGEGTGAIRDHRDVVGVLALRPRVHDESVVDGDAEDVIDAVGLESRGEGVVGRQVGGGAGGGEGSGKGEDNDSPALKKAVSCLICPLAVGRAGLEGDVGDNLSLHPSDRNWRRTTRRGGGGSCLSARGWGRGGRGGNDDGGAGNGVGVRWGGGGATHCDSEVS